MTGININVAAGLVAAIGDVRRISRRRTRELCRGKSASAPVRTWSGAAWPHQQARSQPHARHAGRGGLGSRKAPGPLVRFSDAQGRRGHQIAAVAVARKFARSAGFAQQGWHLPMGASGAGCQQDPREAAAKAGRPARKAINVVAYAYNVKELRDREIDVARHAEHAYEQFVSDGSRVVLKNGARVPPMRSDGDWPRGRADILLGRSSPRGRPCSSKIADPAEKACRSHPWCARVASALPGRRKPDRRLCPSWRRADRSTIVRGQSWACSYAAQFIRIVMTGLRIVGTGLAFRLRPVSSLETDAYFGSSSSFTNASRTLLIANFRMLFPLLKNPALRR